MKVWYTMWMKLKNNLKIFFLSFSLVIFSLINSYSNENFFEEGEKMFQNKNYEKSKFLFHRSIVFNPKKIESYIYLAKIYKIEEKENQQKKNINTDLLLDQKNEEALFMLIDLELERSNISEVKELKERFQKACSTLCDKITSIDQRLNNIESKNES